MNRISSKGDIEKSFVLFFTLFFTLGLLGERRRVYKGFFNFPLFLLQESEWRREDRGQNYVS